MKIPDFGQPIQKHIFLWLHVLGWLVYWLSSFLAYYTQNESYNILQWTNFTGLLLTYVVGYSVSLLMIRILQRLDLQHMVFVRMVGRMLLIVFPLTFCWILFDRLGTSLLYAGDFSRVQLVSASFVYSMLARLPMLLFWGALYTVFRLWNAWYGQRQQAREALHLAQRAQLEMLRYQLNPHFFFNALNTIRALIDQDRKDARSMVTELSEFLRYSLTRRDRLFVPLADEIEAVEHYFAVEKKRYEEKLEVDIQLANGVESSPVLCFVLHPLVENAVKYGMQSSDMPLRIGIKASMVEGETVLEVSNSGRWLDQNEERGVGTGTGLKNLRERLQNAYGDGYKMQIREEENTVVAQLHLTGRMEEFDAC